jgi:hypothetical protein
MNNRQTALILLIATTLIMLTVKYMPPGTRFYNVSAVGTTGPFGIYWDKNCTQQVTSINWTTLTPGSSKNITVYVRNLSNTTCYLSVATTNWNPPNAPTYLKYSWTSTTSKIDAGKTLEVKQTLKVTPDITGISNFSFDITFQQLNSYRWDVNQDHKVDVKDIYIVTRAYGSTPQTADGWNPQADINGDSTIDVKDTYLVAKHFGETY